jgi:hypothetical protein
MKSCILTVERIYVLSIILRTKSDYFPTPQELIGLCNLTWRVSCELKPENSTRFRLIIALIGIMKRG